MVTSNVDLVEECFTTLQSGHLLCHSKANNGQAGVGFLINKKWKRHILRVTSISPRVAELVLWIAKLKIMQVYAPTTSYSKEHINSFYNDVDDTLGKPNTAQIVKRINPMETATGTFELDFRNERGDTLVERATSRKYKTINTMIQKKAGKRWTWKSPNDVAKAEIDYIHQCTIVARQL